jgi:dienelactone hydrolase
MLKNLVFLVLFASSAAGEVVLDIPKEVSFFEAPVVRVSGLPPLHVITIRATCVDAAGGAFTSSAAFTPHSDGVIDTSRSIANGDYNGVDAMGLMWSLKGKGMFQLPLSGGLTTTFDVLDEQGQTLASTTMLRRVLPSDVKITELRRPESTLVGRFYEHAAGAKRAAVLTLTGSNGGIDERMAPLLASNGFNVLALAYYHFEGLPENLMEAPLEYFRDAVQWMKRQPSVDPARIAIVGVSKGAEAALTVTSHYPELAQAVVAFVPTDVIWEGVDSRARFGGDAHFDAPGVSSWSIDGKGLPYVHKVISEQRIASRPAAFLDAYEPALRKPVDPAAVINVERIRGAIFLVSAGDDLVWPSLEMGRAIRKRLAEHHFRYAFELHEYPLAGHLIAPPGSRVNWNLGGTPPETAKAGVDAWARALSFLKLHLQNANVSSKTLE